MLRTDADIQKNVVAELRYDPSLRDDDIAVAVRDGVVTLAGFVDSYTEKWTAERVAGSTGRLSPAPRTERSGAHA